MYNQNNSLPKLIQVQFSYNEVLGNDGGGMYNFSSSPSLIQVQFSNNKSRRGGGIYNNISSPSLIQVQFSNNKSRSGGGVYNNSSSLILIHTTFFNNTATDGGGGIFYNSSGDRLTLINSIIWGNKRGTTVNNIEVNTSDEDKNMTIAYSVLEGGTSAIIKAGTFALNLTETNVGTDNTLAKNVGVYIQQQKTPTATNYFYSVDNTNWFSDISLATATTLPTGTGSSPPASYITTSGADRPTIGAALLP